MLEIYSFMGDTFDYEILIRILHSFLNRSITFILNRCYNPDPIGSEVTRDQGFSNLLLDAFLFVTKFNFHSP